jgi:hypothetical protein
VSRICCPLTRSGTGPGGAVFLLVDKVRGLRCLLVGRYTSSLIGDRRRPERRET